MDQPSHLPVLGAIAAGGALGSAARYGVAVLMPQQPATGFPWATLTVNAAGSLLIGVLMVLVGGVWSRHQLLRPFVGVGLLGGFTTFSAAEGEAFTLLRHGEALLALAYLALTALLALAAVTLGVAGARMLTRRLTT